MCGLHFVKCIKIRIWWKCFKTYHHEIAEELNCNLSLSVFSLLTSCIRAYQNILDAFIDDKMFDLEGGGGTERLGWKWPCTIIFIIIIHVLLKNLISFTFSFWKMWIPSVVIIRFWYLTIFYLTIHYTDRIKLYSYYYVCLIMRCFQFNAPSILECDLKNKALIKSFIYWWFD